MANIYPIVVADDGSEGWIFARGLYPAALLDAGDGRDLSFFQATCQRLKAGDGIAELSVICSRRDRTIAEQQLLQIGTPVREIGFRDDWSRANAVLTPVIQSIVEEEPDAICAVLPASHVVAELAKFIVAVRAAAEFAAKRRLVLFVAGPEPADVAKDYVRKGKKLEGGGVEVFSVSAGAAAPGAQEASFCFGQPGYFWNSGISVSYARTLLEAYEQMAPAKISARPRQKPQQSRSLAQYPRASLLVLDAGWIDAGRCMDLLPAASLTPHRLAAPSGDRGVLSVDLNEMIDAPEVVVVANIDSAENVASFVRQVRETEPGVREAGSRVNRHWGSFEWLASGDRYRVKLLQINPGSQLQSRLHHHRGEHWVVLGGTAKVMREQVANIVHENEAIYIAASAWHGLENPGRLPLVILEVQSGSYLGDDDVVHGKA